MSLWTFSRDLNRFISDIGVATGWIAADATTTGSEEAHVESQDCIICLSVAPIPSDSPTSSCSHVAQVCIVCLRRLIITSIDTGNFIAGISCPTEGCTQRMIYSDIQKWADVPLFERYDRLLLLNSLRADRQYVSCLNPACEAGQEHSGGDNSSIVTCWACGSKQCFRHQVPWHDGLTCKQWDEHLKKTNVLREGLTDDWMKENTKLCPGEGCGLPIYKESGCDHMRCVPPVGCGHQYCWYCLAPWEAIIKKDNSMHYDSCKYYSGLPGARPAPVRHHAASTNSRRSATDTTIESPTTPTSPGGWARRKLRKHPSRTPSNGSDPPPPPLPPRNTPVAPTPSNTPRNVASGSGVGNRLQTRRMANSPALQERGALNAPNQNRLSRLFARNGDLPAPNLGRPIYPPQDDRTAPAQPQDNWALRGDILPPLPPRNNEWRANDAPWGAPILPPLPPRNNEPAINAARRGRGPAQFPPRPVDPSLHPALRSSNSTSFFPTTPQPQTFPSPRDATLAPPQYPTHRSRSAPRATALSGFNQAQGTSMSGGYPPDRPRERDDKGQSLYVQHRKSATSTLVQERERTINTWMRSRGYPS